MPQLIADPTNSQTTAAEADSTMLVVDMDGSLLRTDTLHEMMLATAVRDPKLLLKMPGWLKGGKAGFKKRLADHLVLDPANLPVNSEVLQIIKEARGQGRRVALVSAADERQVARVAEHFGIFDEWHGTRCEDGAENLSGAAKANLLVERFGDRGFDYVGDCDSDKAVWKHARRAITVDAGGRLRRDAENGAQEAHHLGDPLRKLAPYLRAMRPHQWVKNLLVFIPVLASHEAGVFGAALMAFAAFSLTASSVYVINDLLDLEADRAHPRKKTRPFAAGEISASDGIIMSVALLASAFALSALLLPAIFSAVLALYFLGTLAYSLVLKRMLVLDIWTLSGLYTLRILAGSASSGILPSAWLVTFSLFIFFALAAVKRQGELVDRNTRGELTSTGRAYTTLDLPIIQGMALASGYAAVVVFSLYINNPLVEALYPFYKVLWLIPTALLFWISHMVMAAHRGRMHDDPIVFAARDRLSQLTGIAILLSVAVASGGFQ